MTLDLRLVAYQPNGARIGVMPTPQTIQASAVLGDVGAISVPYPDEGPRSAAMHGAVEVALEVTYNGGLTWSEPDDMRYLRLRRKGDQVKRPDTITYDGPSYVWRLSKANVLPEGKLNNDGKRPFLSATPGAIMRTLAQEAQARGALAGMDFSTFNENTDSAGRPWQHVVTLYYAPGIDYLKVLLNLSDQGLVDFSTRGRSLLLYDADGQMAGSSGVTLHRGRDLLEAPYQGTLEGLADFVFLMGDDGVTFSRTNPEAAAPWGRWETFISQGGVSDTGTMTVLTDAALETASRERVENTYGLNFAATNRLPFRDYRLGQDVNVATGGIPVPLRLRQITLTRDDKGVTSGNVVLNDRFLEAEVRQARRVTGITGGATLDGGTGARPVDNTRDTLAPAQPAEPVGASLAYLDDEGKPFAQVTLTWPDVTENTDGTACTDLDAYEPVYRLDGDTAWITLPPVTAATAYVSGLQPNTWYEFAVTARDTSGNRSAMSPAARVLTAADADAPEQPSPPVVTPYLGQLLLTWDGLNAVGGGPPLDFAKVEFHLSQSSGFIPDGTTYVDATTAATGGATVATGLAYGVTYYARLVMVDRSGNRSAPSAEVAGVPPKAKAGDIESVTANQITAGNISAAITISGRIATSLAGQRVEINAQGIKQYMADGTLAVDISPVGSTFSGTVRTAAFGPRAELRASLGQSELQFYTGMTSETAPGRIVTTVAGTGATADATLWLYAPEKDSMDSAYLSLSSRDADTGADMTVQMFNGSVYWLSDNGYGHHWYQDASGHKWLTIWQDAGTFGANMNSDGSLNFYADNQINLQTTQGAIGIQANQTVDITAVGNAVNITATNNNRVKVLGILRHEAGDLELTDAYGMKRLFGGQNADGAYLRSDNVYSRTYTDAANVFVNSSGTLGRSTSLARFKEGIDRTWGQHADLDAILALAPTSYYDAGNLDRLARMIEHPDDDDAGDDVVTPKRILGLIAEDVEALGLTDLLTYDGDGNLNGVAYERLAVALLPVLQDHHRRLHSLDSRA